MSKFSGIIEWLEISTGPDRQIDIAIGKLCPPERIVSDGSWHEENDVVRFPVVTASVDAAIAFVERMLPAPLYRLEKHSRSITADATRTYWATAGLPGMQEEAYAPTAPLAILLAIFRAIEANEDL